MHPLKNENMINKTTATTCFALISLIFAANASAQSLVYHDSAMTDSIGHGQHIVFLAGDHEYRGEESLPALARILARHHGFKCTVLFDVDETTGFIKPGHSNMPGLEALESADLMVMFLRFQNLPDDQMQHIADYVDRGGPIVGMRTSTHAFKIPAYRNFHSYDFQYGGDEFKLGFGRQILGETWAGHYGTNHVMSTRLDLVEAVAEHPILRGITNPWVQAGGYWADPIEGVTVLANAQPLTGMTKDSPPADDKDPCPGCWTREYTGNSGTTGRVFTTTYGASEDILDDDYRRMTINAILWSAGMEDQIAPDLNIEFVGPYNPVTFGFETYRRNVKPLDLAAWDSPIMPDTPTTDQPVEPEGPDVEEQPLSPLELETDDHICLVGNALGERMQHHNWFETLLHANNPELQLTVRNLCFPGDEPDLRLRSKNFGSPDSHLTHSKASVVLFYFGFNESFAGESGLERFETDLRKLIAHTRSQDYNGDGNAPRIVLVSPIAFESTGDVDLPDGEEHNAQMKLYAEKMKEIADDTKIGYANLFDPTLALYAEREDQLTLNGAHLSSSGYKELAPILYEQLLGAPAETSFDLSIKSAIDDKNFHWWHRYRAVNGFSIYGDRGKAGRDGSNTYNNEDVMERERAILDRMTANRDQRIWKIAAAEPVPDTIDDSNTLDFIEPATNVGMPDDPNIKHGKLGTLEYLSAEEQQKLFKLAPGYEINLVASEEQFPELANPVNINFDNEGRLWVATMESYPHWKPKSKMNDKILIFEDNDNDGRSDECIVFADSLHQPTGFEIGNGGAYVAQQPDILFLSDDDGDDKADTRRRQLVGFGSADSHHGIAGFTWGPGGNLYFQEGTFKFSQVESPYGLTRMREAGIWVYNPRSQRFGSFVSFTFSNPWGHIFDRWGQSFVGDASGGNCYWSTPISGHIEYPLKHPGGSHDGRIQKYVGKDKGYKFPTFYKQRTRPLAGCEIVSSRHFPDDAQGNWLVTNCITERSVLNHKIEEKDSGFLGTEVPAIVSCDDGNFRPVDVEFAPDGSLYIVDWHNALIGHLQHNLRDPGRDHSHGRIWRITHKDRPLLTPPKIAGAPVADLLELLKEPEDRTRYRVRRELGARKKNEVVEDLKTWIASLDESDPEIEHHLLEGLWVYQTQNVVEPELLAKLLKANDHRARAAATRVLSFWLDRVDSPVELLKQRIADGHPRVRLEALRALSFMEGDAAMEAGLEVLEHEMDYYLHYTLDETMRALEN